MFTQTSEKETEGVILATRSGQQVTAEKERDDQSKKWSYKPNSDCTVKSILHVAKQINFHMRISMPFSSHAGSLGKFSDEKKSAKEVCHEERKSPDEDSVSKLQIFNNTSILDCCTIPCRPRLSG